MRMKKLTKRNTFTTKRLTRTIPPKAGPVSQGLNIPNKQVKVVRLEKINGRNR